MSEFENVELEVDDMEENDLDVPLLEPLEILSFLNDKRLDELFCFVVNLESQLVGPVVQSIIVQK